MITKHKPTTLATPPVQRGTGNSAQHRLPGSFFLELIESMKPARQPTTLKSAAVIIGIDNYAFKPLSSAVNDAREFQSTLLELGLVEQKDITLIVAPQGGTRDDASFDTIHEALLPFYEDPDRCERLFFFFAGHGISSYTDEAHNVIRPALLAQDVRDLARDGRRILDFLELRNLLRGSGPSDQLFFIDACRDMKYSELPKIGTLGWGRRRPDQDRDKLIPPADNAQATLYAVAPLGEAVGVVDGQGVMTSHLLAALKSERLAVNYNVTTDNWQIDIQSLAEYVRNQVEETVKDISRSARIYMLPQLDAPHPPVAPLLTWVDPPIAPLTVHITPDQAAGQTEVKVILRGEVLSAQGLPPRKNHDILLLRPQQYRLQASNPTGVVSPESQTVDVRRQSELTLQVQAGAKSPMPDSQLPSMPVGGAPARPEVTMQSCSTCGTLGRISATAQEYHTRIEVTGRESPFVKRSALGTLEEDLPSGPYWISFRLGDQPFSQGDIYLLPGQEAVVRPAIAFTPLVSEALGLSTTLPRTVQLSETLGDLQAGLRDLMLPMIALKPFDQSDEYFGHFYDLVDKAPPNSTGEPWLSIVLAVDGNEWAENPAEVLESVRLHVYDDFGRSGRRLVPLRRLRRKDLAGYSASGMGLERVRLGLLPARSSSFRLVMKSEQFGDFELALCAGAQRVTVVTLTLQPDGRLFISQSLMRYPGKYQLYLDRGEPYGDDSMSRLVQQVQLAQDLYRRGDLAEAGWDLLNSIAYTKWIELSASCLTFYAWQERLQRENHDNPLAREQWLTIANNLNKYFGDLPDPQIIYGQAYPDQAAPIYTRLLESNQVPILAESTRRLARFAEENHYPHSAVVRWARRIPASEMWTAIGD
jgi:hypothetical protein